MRRAARLLFHFQPTTEVKDLTGQTDWETDQAFLFYKEETFFISGPQDRKVDRSTLAYVFKSHMESQIDLCYMMLKT